MHACMQCVPGASLGTRLLYIVQTPGGMYYPINTFAYYLAMVLEYY